MHRVTCKHQWKIHRGSGLIKLLYKNALGKFPADACEIKSVSRRIPLLTHLQLKGQLIIVQKQLRLIPSFPLCVARN